MQLHLRSLVRRHVLPSIQLRCAFFSTGASASSSSGAAASKVSKSLPRFRSTEKSDAVLGFFRSQGLDGANVRKIIARKPGLLTWDVETKLAPRFKLLRDLGFSESDAVHVVMLHPIFLSYNIQNTLLPRLKFWESLFGSREILLENLLSYNRFMTRNIENVLRPNINFLRDECGIPEERISLVLRTRPTLIVHSRDALRALVDRTEGLGIPRKSKMFLWVLNVLHVISREKFEAQVKLMHSFGWSNSDFSAAIKKRPTFLILSIELLQRKMEFLVNDVGISPSDIACRPVPLVLSLEKRLIPRFRVMQILKSEGLWKSTNKLPIFFSTSGPKFLQKYVLPYQDILPTLLEV
ncbi:transcription termination factor MTERF8, chloroplastic-like [Curcuma longa]|uniref:transcription termination factor MTERF8, chloroplastic-like n=1 Tax=Curcuma longa TaxID=136217 RepID=UPI003D9F6AB9